MDFQNEGKYLAVYFVKNDLTKEKMRLLDDMRELSLNYWGGVDASIDDQIKELNDRISEINTILENIRINNYRLPED